MLKRQPLCEHDVTRSPLHLPWLRTIEINTLFARAVLEQGVPGRVYVDSNQSPTLVFVRHRYGMSLLASQREPADADAALMENVLQMDRLAPEWLQLWPAAWASRFAVTAARAEDLHAPPVEQHTRVNFTFSFERYRARRSPAGPATPKVTRADRSAFFMPGTVVPGAFWKDVSQFLDVGAGFAVMIDDKPVALAFSAFVSSSQLEIGIETVEEHRGRGLAKLVCAALIDDCLARGLEPVWACRLENRASYRLAQSLGFVPVRRLPYFRMPPRWAVERIDAQAPPIASVATPKAIR